MFSVFLELVKKVGIFVIIGQTIMNFGISKKYEKHMKLVISFMVAAQIIFAFGVYFKQDDNNWHIMSAEEYLKKWDVNMKEVEERMEESKDEMTLRMVEEFRQPELNRTDKSQNRSIKVEKVVIP